MKKLLESLLCLAALAMISCSGGDDPSPDVKDLSSGGTANCYIVSKAGGYKFRADVKGNSREPVGLAERAEVLWETFGTSVKPKVGSVISSVELEDGYVTFRTPVMLTDGNAVIAVKDVSDNILWSWHIWVCSSYDPKSKAQEYSNGAGKMMDRNLGATSASAGDVCSLGLLYQWGRKDPFLSSGAVHFLSSDNQTAAESTIVWPDTVGSTPDQGTIEYSVKHPTTFIGLNENSYDWIYSDSPDAAPDRWKRSKTMYDPCPRGWRVPDGGSDGCWARAFGTMEDVIDASANWNFERWAMNFGASSESIYRLGPQENIWYPAAGYRDPGIGILDGVGTSGCYWSCTPGMTGYQHMMYMECYKGDIQCFPSYYYFRSMGNSVRCVAE